MEWEKSRFFYIKIGYVVAWEKLWSGKNLKNFNSYKEARKAPEKIFKTGNKGEVLARDLGEKCVCWLNLRRGGGIPFCGNFYNFKFLKDTEKSAREDF